MHQQAATAAGVVTERSGLRFQRCTWCASAQHRPALVCRVCRSESFRWEYSAGFGRIVSSPTLARTPVLPPLLTTIRLDEGPLVDGWVRGDSKKKLWADARVRLSEAEDASGRPVFELS